jgi:peptidoglycan/xylan/chitin deacetylase (PgdA/CDA1 family)
VTGTVTISMELELGWGVQDFGDFTHLSTNGQVERIYLDKLLDVCEHRHLPISFDVVGHLFLEECIGFHDSPHPDGWFDGDPGTNYREDPLFYAPEMIDAIRLSETEHEICSHTFSHALFDEVSRETARWELRHTQNIHEANLGKPTVSLVPPRHHSPPYEILRESGIEILRPAIHQRSRTKIHRFKQLLAGPIPTRATNISDGIVETYCTTYPSLTASALPSGQRRAHAAFRYLPVTLRKRLHLHALKRATRNAARYDEHLHLWCHLYDLSNELQWQTVNAYFRWLDEFREEHDIRIATMNELNSSVRNDA